MTTTREQELVELVSASGEAVGSATVAEAHTAPGVLHRAFSVLLFDGRGRVLLQQRAAVKTRFPLRWANTCCGHPGPSEPVTVAAWRRLGEELGIAGVDLEEAGIYTYAAVDDVTGRVEREYDHVLIGLMPADLAVTPDPAEVVAAEWVSLDSLPATGVDYAPWFRGVLDVARAADKDPLTR